MTAKGGGGGALVTDTAMGANTCVSQKKEKLLKQQNTPCINKGKGVTLQLIHLQACQFLLAPCAS